MGCGSSRDHNASVVPTESKKINEQPQSNSEQKFPLEQDKSISSKYIIKNKLGEGIIGVARLIQDKITGEEKAVKIISKKTNLKDLESRLIQEFNIMKQFAHPNIIKAYENFQDIKNFYIVTEIVKGGELFEKILSLTNFSEKDAAYIFSQLLSVVQFSHEHQIMHRDLKPENILLEYNQNQKETKFSIKVIDWGQAKPFVSGNKEKSAAGTPYFVSPEILKKNYDEKCDLWSCGVILYIMLSGEPPFFGNQNELSQSILSVKFDMEQEVWKSISSECKDLIKKLICTEDKRLNAQQAQDHPWVKKNVEAFKQGLKETGNKEVNILQLSKLKKFTQQNKLQIATLSFIASTLASKQDREEFKQVFVSLDKNNDGSLSKQEISQGYEKYKTNFQGDYNVDAIFQNVDLNKNGKINFEEFIAASIQQDQIYLSSKLKEAFTAFDLDGNGQLSKDELKSIFGPENNDVELTKILKQFDSSGDNQISLNEFQDAILAISKKQ